MAHIEPCTHHPSHIHIISDRPNSIVCTGDKVNAELAIRHGCRMGIISLADGTRLLAEVSTSLTLAPELIDRVPPACGRSHTFVAGLFDALNAITGLGNPHPHDVS